MPTDTAVPWHRSLRWRLTLSFVGLLAILLAVAGGVEFGLLRQSVLSSRGQSLEATFADARAILLAQQRSRQRLGRPALGQTAVAVALAKILAEARISAAVYSPDLTLLASAAPGTVPGPAVLTGVSLPTPPVGDLQGAAQSASVRGPTLVGSGGGTLVLVVPLVGRFGSLLGEVELTQPAGPIQSELGAAAAVVALGGAAVLLVALLTGLALTARGLGPLRRLTAAAESLGRGDLSRRSGLPPRGDEVGVLATVFDEMAESVERTVRLREAAERQMRQFIADASHELRTPLTAIKGYLDVLQRGSGESLQVVHAALPVMSREAERMRVLVMDLLTLARADEGRALRPRPVELDSFLDRFLADHPTASRAGHPEGQRLVALADPEALTTIATNLQNNAERHGGGEAVSWSAVEAGGMVGLRCTDQGPGIAAEDLPHVFERFYRAGTSRSRQDGGSGLGLAIVRSLAEAQGGSVSVESVLGKGAAFTLLLPPSAAGRGSPARVGADV